MKAKDILKPDETAIMIFTDGRNLSIKEDGTGASGVWKISKKASAHKVIIYFRNKEKAVNEIYVGDFVQLLPSNEKGYENRFAVEFNSMKFSGFTESNWNEFTETKHGAISPVKYVR